MERRFLCNVLLEGKEEAWKVIESMRSIFRGFSWWMQNAVYFASDRPGDPVAQFTQADVEDGMFSYSRAGLKARHTVALVTWIDPDDFYSRAVEVVEDPEGIAIFGVKELELSAFGCTSRGQARRAGLAALLTERLEAETVTFKARSIAAYCNPGQIIKIADPKKAAVRNGGLVVEATANNTITVDSPVTIDGSYTTLTCLMPDGEIQERQVVNAPGTYTTLFVNPGFPERPLPESNWILATASIQPQLYRVLNRSPVAGSSESMHEITALEYRADKYGAIENGWDLQPRPTRQVIPPVVQSVAGVLLNFIESANGLGLDVNWSVPLNPDGTKNGFIVSYQVEYKRVDGTWQGTQTTSLLNVRFPISNFGSYQARVATIDLLGSTSNWVESSVLAIPSSPIYQANFRSRFTSMFAGDF